MKHALLETAYVFGIRASKVCGLHDEVAPAEESS
ncbi:hypothetical protein HNP84_006719 [Thermocatellispora tengchongensis]|uniref:Uncharacterized protein n=1 Tax=Thermocatellispora tengchongensis TaxID=1073253 RepID=A0A840PIN6_9ACTN|nr:hypothetical protein [Thermocatellispora tengchongensis]